MTWILIVLVIVFVVCLAAFARTLRKKNVDIILAANIKRKREPYEQTRHVFFCITDHFEPFWHNTDKTLALDRVEDFGDAEGG